jgi:hypothetical protein
MLGPSPSLNLNLVLLHSLQAFIQKDRQTGIPTDKRTEGQIDRRTDTDRHDKWSDGRTDRHTEETDIQTNDQMGKRTDSQNWSFMKKASETTKNLDF